MKLKNPSKLIIMKNIYYENHYNKTKANKAPNP